MGPLVEEVCGDVQRRQPAFWSRNVQIRSRSSEQIMRRSSSVRFMWEGLLGTSLAWLILDSSGPCAVLTLHQIVSISITVAHPCHTKLREGVASNRNHNRNQIERSFFVLVAPLVRANRSCSEMCRRSNFVRTAPVEVSRCAVEELEVLKMDA